jgi:hypothetical protein
MPEIWVQIQTQRIRGFVITTVPEPSSVITLSTAAVIVILYKRRRNRRFA